VDKKELLVKLADIQEMVFDLPNFYEDNGKAYILPDEASDALNAVWGSLSTAVIEIKKEVM
jgi:RNAse (barnase) inhibitor barstar